MSKNINELLVEQTQRPTVRQSIVKLMKVKDNKISSKQQKINNFLN